jgi:hypothetical protein
MAEDKAYQKSLENSSKIYDGRFYISFKIRQNNIWSIYDVMVNH